MNDNTTYEQLIAQKLDQLSVPDHSDTIWGAIEKQLDVVMPVNMSAPTPMPKGFIKPGIIIVSTIAIVVALFFITIQIFKNTNKPNAPLEKTIPLPPLENPADTIKISIPEKGLTFKSVEAKKNTPQLPSIDSTIQKETTIPFTKDKTDSIYTAPILPKPVMPDSITTQKKSRGVTGIGNDDYRIVPKDSVRK